MRCGDAQKGAGCGHMVFLGVLAEVLERRDGSGTGLDLVQDNERSARIDVHVEVQRERGDDSSGIEVGFEEPASPLILVKAHIGDAFEMQLPELFEDPGFADLARAVDDEGLAAFASLPLDQLIHQLSLHGEPPSTNYALIIVQKHNNKGVIMMTDAKIRRNYSHSFTLVCCGAIPIGSSLVVGFVHLAAESLRVSSRRRLGQTLGQIRELFRNRKPTVSFLSGDKIGLVLRP